MHHKTLNAFVWNARTPNDIFIENFYDSHHLVMYLSARNVRAAASAVVRTFAEY